MKLRLKLLLSILILVLLYAGYYWGIPAAINSQHKNPVVQNIIQRELGIPAKLKKPTLKMGLTPSVWIDASSFEIADKNESPLLIVNPKLKIDLLPLLFGQVHLAYFSCSKIDADLKIDKNHRFYIGNYLIMQSSNPRISIENSKMDIDSYNIKLKDEFQNKNILVKGNYFILDKYNSKKYIKCSVNSNLKVNEHYSTINADVDFKLPFAKGFDTNEIVFDGTVTNLNLADLSPYIKKMSNGEIQQTQGILNIDADTKVLNRKTNRITVQAVLDNLMIKTKDKQSSLSFKNKLDINAIVDASKNVLSIKKFKISSGRINADIKGQINKISSKNPFLDLSIIVNKSRIEDFISLLPAQKLNNINLIALKKYGYYSDLEGKIFIKGKTDEPEINGEFLSTNGYIIKPLNIPKATVKLKFLGKKVYIDVNVPVSNSEKITVKGPIELYGDQKALLDISSTANADLATTESILNPLHEIFYFDLGPLPIMKLQGFGNIKLKVDGSKKDPHLFGVFNFKNTTGSFDGVNALLKNTDGSLYFNNKETHFVTQKAFLDSKPIKVDGKCSLSGDIDYDITANSQNLAFIIDILRNSSKLGNMNKSVSTLKSVQGKSNINLKLKGKAGSIDDFVIGKTICASGNIKLLGNNISFSNLDISARNLFGNIKFNNNDADFDLYSVVDKSTLAIKGKTRNNVLNLKAKLNNLVFSYSDIPVKIYSGNLELNNNKLILYKVNALLDSMPVLVDGMITDIFKTPYFNIYLNSKPNQQFIEKYINKNAIYPLKIKGDIIYSARVQGTRDSFNAQTDIDLKEGSNIYYMGSTLGDTDNPIKIFLDTSVLKNSIYVNNFQYDKLISSQNDKEFISPQLNAKGQININKNTINLNNFKVKTQNPTDAKIFNILFKKPMVKQGLFTSNVVINGPINSPKLIGALNFTGINIPLVDTTIKDISLNFGDKSIEIKSKGDVLSNNVVFLATMENRLTAPYILSDVDIYLGNLDVNEVVKSINKLELNSNMNKLPEQKQDMDISSLVIKNGKLKADSVLVKNIFAKNLTADFSLNEKLLFSLENFKFDAAEGSINGNFKYNLLNSESELKINVDQVNANSAAQALFDLPDQIFGSLTGQVDLICNGKTHKTCMDTLSGKGAFRVADGRMPKLGSLEYLLKAANIVKSGVTGITLNSVIDLLTPLKTGQFENINGNFTINSGIADSIQIFSKGKDLSLFLNGKYNFSTLVADMEVFGRLSKKITTILGPVGNASLNTLFNTIPGLNLDETNKTEFVNNLNKIPGFELNDKTYRIFSVKIYGDINGDDYVQSFKWIE